MYKRQIYQIAESNRIESKLFCTNWNALPVASKRPNKNANEGI